tara:strand:- start:1352 stop:1480 length:129 start_codon:yes stop_codon:yes gene_type:complete
MTPPTRHSHSDTSDENGDDTLICELNKLKLKQPKKTNLKIES